MRQELNGIGLVVLLGLTKGCSDIVGVSHRDKGPDVTSIANKSVQEAVHRIRVFEIEIGDIDIASLRGGGEAQTDRRAFGSSLSEEGEEQARRQQKKLVRMHSVKLVASAGHKCCKEVIKDSRKGKIKKECGGCQEQRRTDRAVKRATARGNIKFG